ncbi:COOH NH2 ligase [Pseudoalteromonas phage RIO-1]|uniref:COOH NH2 ligase n=1 Tax=Pseudoalteromonas phage RIO-1 TaxID=1316739 RepID=R4JKG7_9CAUD|nr:COOH.NH2 ligase [Pseudoalteromonas phage RIO-1]AGK87024.1 COOH NH2 ligase [Pseudoalteromonas phage RIO-1]
MTARYEEKKSIDDVQVGDLVRISDTCWEPNKTYLESLGVPQVFPVIGKSATFLTAKTNDGGESQRIGKYNLEHYPRRIIESNADFEIEDRVVIRQDSRYYNSGRLNPDNSVQGSVNRTDYHVYVEWDGLGQNCYDYYDLELVQYMSDVPEPEDKTESIEGILFGSDLELFVVDTRTDKIIPAGMLVPGTKAAPFKMKTGTVHPDGLAVEVGCDPASTWTELNKNLEAILAEVKAEFFPEDYYVYSEKSVATKTCIQDFEKHRAEHPDWFISGCAPELDAGTLAYNNGTRTDVNPKKKLRCKDKFFVGMHLHLGFTEWDNTCFTRIDVGCLVENAHSNVWLRDEQVGGERQKYYGGRKCFRMKPYGVEDRSLAGHTFLKDKKVIADLAYAYQCLIKEAL